MISLIQMNEIIQRDNEILRQKAEAVSIEDIKSRKIETVIRRMIKALDNEEDGVAIAAPQIGESVRIFVVSKKIFEIMEEEKTKTKSKRENLNDFEQTQSEYQNLVFINPEILRYSKKKITVEEGCLSIRWLYGKVERFNKILVKAYDKEGKLFTLGGTGLLAQVFQHEIDHLNGVLFIDTATGLKEMPPEKNAK